MELKLILVLIGASLAQQQQHQPLSPLGVKYSASTDVSHISFNSPLVSYGDKLSQIQLPAAPIQPGSLKQADQDGDAEGQQQDDQFISVQQYPHNPQFQSNAQGLSFNQNLPPQSQADVRYVPQTEQQQQQQQQQQYVLPQEQPFVHPQYQQQQYVLPQQQPQYQQQYSQPQQQQFLGNQPQLQQFPQQNGYFSTGPFAAQYPQPVSGRQVAPSTFASPSVAPSAPFVSRVSFNRPTAGFSYEF